MRGKNKAFHNLNYRTEQDKLVCHGEVFGPHAVATMFTLLCLTASSDDVDDQERNCDKCRKVYERRESSPEICTTGKLRVVRSIPL